MKKLWLALIVIVYSGIAKCQVATYLDTSKSIDERIEDALSRMTLDEKISVIHAQSKFSSRGVPRLGFPDFWTTDGPNGIRPDVLWDKWDQAGHTNDSCVAFPALTCLAATWNPGLGRIYGKSLGEEARYRGKDMVLGPGVNIYRTPLNGRNFEYLGEDPFLAAEMAVPYIQGLQSTGVSACVKHFCLNNAEWNRSKTNVVVSDRALHEIYLPAFEAAVKKGKVWAVMGAYNSYRNQHNCENKYLLTDLLKHDWNFDGVVVSDWGGTHNTVEAASNGLDMEFGTGTNGLDLNTSNAYDNYYLAQPYKKLIKAGVLPLSQLDDKVRRVLRLFYRTTMNRERSYGFLCSDAHYEIARAVGEEGVVLLKNKNHLLPINTDNIKNVLVIGENAIKKMVVGGGSSSLKTQHEITPLEGIRDYIRTKKLPIDVIYSRGYVGDVSGNLDGVVTGQDLRDNRSEDELVEEALEKARKADCILFFGGLNKSPHQDCEASDRLSYSLPYGQNRLVEALSKVNKNIVFVSISGNAEELPWINKVSSVIQGWYLGSESGKILAKVIFGDVNPSGKLPFTWPKNINDVPAVKLNAWHGKWRADSLIADEYYKEGIYVGYRGVDHWKTRPLFPFGYGMSYTSFAISNLKVLNSHVHRNDSVVFTVNVKNIGKVAGKEVVQLYIHDDKASVDRPIKELKSFCKVYLKPGDEKTVRLAIDGRALSYYDINVGDWVAEPGRFTAFVGNSSACLPCKVHFYLE